MKTEFKIKISIAALNVLTATVIAQQHNPPNVVIVLADEWRAQATRFNGDPNVKTPNLDQLAARAHNFTNTISCCPVSGPYRASLLTGQYPLSTKFIVNDVELDQKTPSMGKIFSEAGYETAYIGKWHLDGHGRSAFIPVDRRQGFDYWKVMECEHNYNKSFYWGNDDKKEKWDGYDAYAQTADAIQYIKAKKQSKKPFLMILSWGPPHTPFQTAPEAMKNRYRNMKLKLRENVPDSLKNTAIADLIGYYGHISALDSCIGNLQKTLKETGIDKNTIFVFTSDHGAMVRSHTYVDKQRPYEESINVPMLINYPNLLGNKGQKVDMLFNTPDILPTILGLCHLAIPKTVEGQDKSAIITNKEKDTTGGVLIACYHPFGQWPAKDGGKEYRGIRTKQYTYVKDLKGPWLLFDNKRDPFQLNNLVDNPGFLKLRNELEIKLTGLLAKANDTFLPGIEYINKWGYVLDKTGTPYHLKINFQGKPISE
ncbi:MAG: sulfatase [Bacteroidota bacterium]